MAEIELNVLTRQCLARRIDNLELLKDELASWEADRTPDRAKICWHFRSDDARIKLVSLYPSIIFQ